MPTRIDFDESGWLGIEAEAAKLNTRITDEVALDARRGCPVDSGDLLGSIEVRPVPEPLIGRVHVGTQHWDMPEYGGILGAHTVGPYPPTIRKTDQHSHMDAEPYMRPAIYRRRSI